MKAFRCDCKKVIAQKAVGDRAVVFSSIERFGYSIIRFKPYRKSDGKPSQTCKYEGVDWKYCPFCGKPRKEAEGQP